VVLRRLILRDEVMWRRFSPLHSEQDRGRDISLQPESGFRFERLNNPAQRRDDLVALNTAPAELQG